MNRNLAILALATATILLAPSANAIGWDFWNSVPKAPAAKPPSYNADLSAAEGKIQVTQLTGLTALTVLEFTDLSLFIIPQADQLILRQVPKTDSATRAISSTSVNLTDSLTLVTTPYHTWIDGSAADNPPQIDTDATYIYSNSVPDVSINNVVALTDLRPLSKAGPATMTTTTHSFVTAPNAAVSTLDWTLIDLDEKLDLRETTPPYEPTATITTATTPLAIKSLLDEFSLAGADLNGVLNGLKLSTEKVGAVNLDALGVSLSNAGYAVRKITATQESPRVAVMPVQNQIDVIRPAELDGHIVLLANDELADVDESRLTALKDPDAPKTTTVLSQFRTPDAAVCKCFVLEELAPDAGGIVDAFAALMQADKRLDPGVSRIKVDPHLDGPFLPPAPSVDFAQVGRTKQIHAPNVGALTPALLQAVLSERAKPVVPSADLPTIDGNHLVILKTKDPLVKDPDYHAVIQESLDAWKSAFGEFDFSFCTNGCLPQMDLHDLHRYLGQLETFDPRLDLALPDLDYPDDFMGAVFGLGGTLVTKAGSTALNEEAGNMYSTLQLRVLRDQTRLPISEADVELNVFLPGWKGNTVQTYTSKTNAFGYAVFSVLPGMAYNFTVMKNGFATAQGVGASPPPGETEGKEVRMSAEEGFDAFVEQVGNPIALASLGLLAAVGLLVYRRLKSRRRRR